MFKYKVDDMLFYELQQRAVVPKFQRKLVWSNNEKKNFIETLSQGYPFGSILIYKYENDNKYSIIDGLQRFTTIEDYIDNPEKYIDFDDVVESIMDKFIDRNLFAQTTFDNYKIKIKNIIESYVKNKNSTLVDFINAFRNELPEVFGNYEWDRLSQLAEVTQEIEKILKDFIDIDNLKIPTIIFTGDVEELAAVFENLNRGGKKLSKYQVFAAQWSKHELKLDETDLLDRILGITIKRYEDLIETRNVEINNFSREEMSESRTINIAEFCYALGYLISEKMHVFWDKNNEDTANQIGYSTLALVFGVRNKDMSKLVKYFDVLIDSQFLENLVGAILEIFTDINDRFARVFKYPGIKNDKYYGGTTASDFQLLSFFGSLWHLKYEGIADGKMSIKPRYKFDYDTIEKNMVKYFIFDTVQSRWSGTGDTKLDRLVLDHENYYLRELERERFESALLNWHDDSVSKNSINFEPVSKMLYTILTSFYHQNYQENLYDSEHVIPRKTISSIRSQSNHSIPGGSIGNHMYLDRDTNRGKQDLSLYEVTKEGFEIREDFIDYHFYPTKKEFQDIKAELKRKNGDYEQINKTIGNRGKAIITDLVNKIYN
ncbi:DUF262 domain-containing protein [Aerococcaceae bacterium DSM 111176]|nr:DUF262 domain-containing protein [Aerococcaceae bacterium DSM 111176]